MALFTGCKGIGNLLSTLQGKVDISTDILVTNEFYYSTLAQCFLHIIMDTRKNDCFKSVI